MYKIIFNINDRSGNPITLSKLEFLCNKEVYSKELVNKMIGTLQFIYSDKQITNYNVYDIDTRELIEFYRF